MLAKATASCYGLNRATVAARRTRCPAPCAVTVAAPGASRHFATQHSSALLFALNTSLGSPAISFRPHSTCSRPARKVVTAARSTSTEPWWTKDNPPNMMEAHDVQEFVDMLAGAQDKLVIVDFFATWCNACRSLFPKLCKLMAENPDVVFIKVNFDDNRQLCKSLGIKVLPFFHFYKGAEGRVEAFSCSVSKVQRFRDALELHSGAFCNLEPFSGLAEFPEIEPHMVATPDPQVVPAPVSEVRNMVDSIADANATVYETLVSIENAPGPVPAPAMAVVAAAPSNGVQSNGNGSARVPDAVPLELLAGWRAAEIQGNNGNGTSRHPGQEGQLAAAV